MKFIIADTFMKSLSSLAKSDQNLVKQAAFEFQTNPENPGSQFHKLDRAKDARFWSFRVNRDIRIIVHRDGASSLMLCYADHHDRAYKWAERRLLDVHPRTGAAQFVEVRERVEEVVRQVIREQEAPLFDKYEKEYLLGLGVPVQWVDTLRAVGETAFLEIMGELPEEAAERLSQLADGKAVPLPVAAPTADPFAHPDAQRRFHSLETQGELQAALAAPWDRWRIFLHPTQRSLAERTWGGPARVTGGAGTGKSVVALHRAAHLARQSSQPKVLLTTFSKALAARLAHSLDSLMGGDPARSRIDVRHLHAVAAELSGGQGPAFDAIESEGLDTCIQLALQSRENDWLTPRFVRSEWDHVVDAHGITDWQSYRSVSRKGRGVPLSAKKRALTWAVMEGVYAELQRRGQSTFNQLCARALHRLQLPGAPAARYAHAIIDECQDFGPVELRLLRALTEPGGSDLFFCGDEGQRIYKPRASWLSLGIDVRGRSGQLTLNYRTTAQIRACADALLPPSVVDGDGRRESNATESLLSGPPPEMQGYASAATEQEGLTQWLQGLAKEGLALHEIALFARTSRLLKERALAALAGADLPHQALRAEQVPQPGRVVVGTFHAAKGLEFRAVALVGCDKNQVPLRAVTRGYDHADREDFVEQERHLLYVACTRARERLRLSWSGKPCEWLPQRRRPSIAAE